MPAMYLGMKAKAKKHADKSKKKSGIHINPAHKGELHSDLGVEQGEKIPLDKLEEAKHSDDPAVRRRATFAINARSFNHK